MKKGTSIVLIVISLIFFIFLILNFYSQILDFLSGITGILIGVGIGVLTSFLGFLTNSSYQKRQDEKKELKKYYISLKSTRDELDFYLGKLRQLGNEMTNIFNLIKAHKSFAIPSYSLYPDFLEKAKIEQYGFFKNSELVKKIGMCHYELAHVSERLEFFKREYTQGRSGFFTLGNIGSFMTLISRKVTEFEEVIKDIDEELKRVGESIKLEDIK